MTRATEDIIRLVQQESFGKHYKYFLTKDETNQLSISSRKLSIKGNRKLKSILKLSPFLKHGLLRVGGRLQHSSLPYETRHPLILPSNHHVTFLIIDQYHRQEGHSGTLHVLSSTRDKFWIMKGQRVVREALRKCWDCKVREAKVGEQIMAPLPPVRVNPTRPFASTGVDYMGPLMVKIGRSTVKRYGCIFTCLATRALHIEVSESLTTSSFLCAFSRFICRRGRPSNVYSDNGLNFVGAEKVLKDGIQRWNQQQIHQTMLQKNIQWHFNPPGASHQGGVWERMIRSIRRIVTAINSEQIPSDDGLHTTLIEVERILNNRPISPLSDDSRDLIALTPNHILLGVLDSSQPADVFISADGYRRSWRSVQWAAEQFWKRWIQEYLTTLQNRHKWLRPERNVAIGELVLLLDENLKTPRGQWRMGIIEEIFPDQFGYVRRLKVRTSTSSYLRDIRKICVLEAN